MERPLPANLEAERLVLAQVMAYDAMDDFRAVLSDDEFSVQAHRRIWDACCAVYDGGGKPDRVSVAEELTKRRQLEAIGGLTYLLELDEHSPRIVNLDGYVAILRDKSTLRRLMFGCDLLLKKAGSGEDSALDLVTEAGKLWMDLCEPSARSKSFVTAADVVEQVGIERILAPRRDRGIPLPWKWANLTLSGLHAEQLAILGARTSVGKTSAALQIAASACRAGKRGAIFSLEMSNESLIQRIVAQISGVEVGGRRRTPPGWEERAAQSAALGEVMEWPLHFDDQASRNTAGVHAGLRKLASRFGHLDFVIVDHLHILRGAGKYEKRNQEVSDCARSLKLMAKEFKAAFIVPAQLSRRQDMEKREPSLSDLRESGEIEENSDVVIFLHVPPTNEEEMKPAKMIVAKQREGPRDVWTDEMFFQPRYQRFVEKTDGEYRS